MESRLSSLCKNLFFKNVFQLPFFYEVRKKLIPLVSKEYLTHFKNYCPHTSFYSSQVKRNLLFIHIPKTAGTALTKALEIHGSGHVSCHFHQSWMNFNTYHNLFKFTFVRCPYDRMISVYKFINFGGDKLSDDMKIEGIQFFGVDPSIDDFVGKAYQLKLHKKHLLFKPMSQWVCPSDSDQLLVDFVGKYETLQNDFETISQRLEIHSELKVVNPSGSHKRQSLVLSPQSKMYIQEMYEKDFRVFEYDL